MSSNTVADNGLSGDAIAAELRRLMTQGVLSPGVHLRQEELATRFGVSRSPIREALKLLVAEGSVKHDRNRGYFIASLDSAEMEQLYFLRKIIETEVLRTVRWPSPAELKRFRSQLKSVMAFAKVGDYAQYHSAHRGLHFAVFDLSPKAVLVKEAKELWGLTDRYRALLVPELDKIGRDEEEMLEALASQNRDDLLSHFEKSRVGIERTLSRLLASRGL